MRKHVRQVEKRAWQKIEAVEAERTVTDEELDYWMDFQYDWIDPQYDEDFSLEDDRWEEDSEEQVRLNEIDGIWELYDEYDRPAGAGAVVCPLHHRRHFPRRNGASRVKRFYNGEKESKMTQDRVKLIRVERRTAEEWSKEKAAGGNGWNGQGACGDIPAGPLGWVIGKGEESGVLTQRHFRGYEDVEWDIMHLEIEFDDYGVHWFDDGDVEYIGGVHRAGEIKDYNKKNAVTQALKGEIPF